MNNRTRNHSIWISSRRLVVSLVCLLGLASAGCAPATTQPAEPTAQEAVVPAPTQTLPAPTATSEASVPDGWTTYDSQRCEYSLSYPDDMQNTPNGTASRILGIEVADLEMGMRNFMYISTIDPESQNLEVGSIYNYNPSDANFLLKMPVGESQALQGNPQTSEWFTFQRLPDRSISGYSAQAYENTQPWEFPPGTREIRYYLVQDGCTYQIGAYVDTTESDQPGAITQALFEQIVDTIQVRP